MMMMTTVEDDDRLRERALEYLRSQHGSDRKVYEFTAPELAIELDLCIESVYRHMEKLVKKGDWETRRAHDPVRNREMRVWWLVAPEQKEDAQG